MPTSKSSVCCASEEWTGEPDAGNLHVRFDEGEQQGREESRLLFSTLPVNPAAGQNSLHDSKRMG